MSLSLQVQDQTAIPVVEVAAAVVPLQIQIMSATGTSHGKHNPTFKFAINKNLLELPDRIRRKDRDPIHRPRIEAVVLEVAVHQNPDPEVQAVK